MISSSQVLSVLASMMLHAYGITLLSCLQYFKILPLPCWWKPPFCRGKMFLSILVVQLAAFTLRVQFHFYFAYLLSWGPGLPGSTACSSVMLFTLSKCLSNSYIEDFQATLNSYDGLDAVHCALSLQSVLLFFFQCPTRFPGISQLCLSFPMLLWLKRYQRSINLHLENNRVTKVFL